MIFYSQFIRRVVNSSNYGNCVAIFVLRRRMACEEKQKESIKCIPRIDMENKIFSIVSYKLFFFTHGFRAILV